MDFDLLQQVGIGQLKMSEDEFWNIEPRAFFNAVEGFESLRHMDLNVARMQALCYVNAWGAKIKDPKSLWVYPWETKIRTKAEVEAQRKRGKQIAERWQTR